MILADAQTSGGLLIAASDGDRLAAALARRDVSFAEVGRVEDGPPGAIRISGRLADRPTGGIRPRW
jgi:hypothetical protein